MSSQRPRSRHVQFAVAACFTLCVTVGGSAFSYELAGFALENGDVNGDESRDLSDPIHLLSHLFLGSAAPVELAWCGAFAPVVRNGDSNGDGSRDVSDSIHLLEWLYSGGPSPVDACDGLALESVELAGDGTVAGRARGVPRVAPPHSHAFGKSLSEWMELYWRAYFTGGPDTIGRVRLLPIPNGELIEGDFTPENPGLLRGSIDVDLAPGTPFVLPLFAWIGESYDPALGLPDDPAIPDDVLLAGVTPLSLTINGVVIISDANEADFYVPSTPFVPTIEYAEPSSYGSIAAIHYQGCGFVSPPLPVGDHVIHLYERYVVDGLVAVIYDNTWRIHVR